ncbi:MAG: hypothetical protein WC810_24910 [Janthinobacterium sp.]|jgi:hypothetical protein
MSKSLLIRQALHGIEQGEFQDVCNYYLGKIYGGELHSPGSVEEKNKTRPGKPDTYIVLDDGRYILAEITTHDQLDKSKFAQKLKNDLKGCLNFGSLGIKAAQVHSIVLCCNSTVEDITLREELKEIVQPYNIRLRIVPLLTLVDYFYNVGKLFARDVLGIPFETGQVLSKEDFLKQYSKKQIATPLDNALVGRVRELEYLKEVTQSHSVTLISGPAGVGKSRLAMQVMDIFVADHSHYEPYYIISRPESITEDLLSFILPKHSYIVFIDDANRQLENVLSVLSRAIDKDISIKIVMTVRDYARADVEKHLRQVNFKGAYIGSLNDEVIGQIIFDAPFHVKYPEIRDRIVDISKGNARLAIMAANVVKDSNDISLLKDVTTIYDNYFQTITDDAALLNDPLTMKVLGILAFFQTIDTEEAAELNILADFGISLEDFSQKVQLLENLELVEVNFNSIIKIGDQVLGTYLFYQAFIHKKLLNVEQLLFKYFQRYLWRVRDTFLPAINTFGMERVLGTHPEFLLNYLAHIKSNTEDTIRFFEVFGIYLPQKIFVFVSQHTNSLSNTEEEYEFQNAYKKTQPNDHDHILNLLKPFYEGNIKDCITAVGLAVQYVNKKKPLLDVLVNQLKAPFYAGADDSREYFEKQKAIYTFLKNHINDNYAYRILFYYVMQHVLLNTSYSHEVFTTIDNQSAFEPAIGDLRIKFLQDIDQNYELDRTICFDLMMDYLEPRGRGTYICLHVDQPLIAGIIKNHFDMQSFGDSHFVQSYINLLTDRKISINSELTRLQGKYQSPEYKLFHILEADRNTKRRRFGDVVDYKKAYALQVEFVKSNIKIRTLADFVKVQQAVTIYRDFKYWHKSNIEFGLTLVLENTFLEDHELGFSVLAYYLEQGNIGGLIARRLFNVFLQAYPGEVKPFYELIKKQDYKYKQEWLESFFECLPEALITDFYIGEMLNNFKTVSKAFKLHLPSYEQYENVKAGTIKDICEVLLDHAEENPKYGFGFEIPYFFFTHYPLIRDKYLDTAKRLYLQQDKTNHNHDPKGEELFFLMEKDVNFFNEFIDHRLIIYQEHHSAPRQTLTQIWELPEGEEYVYNTIVKIEQLPGYSFSVESFCANFFIQLMPVMEQPAANMLKRLIDTYKADSKMLSIVWEISRNYVKGHYKSLIMYWLKFNPDLEVFKKCDWTNNSFSSTGSRQIWADFRITEYRQVADAIESMEDRYLYVEHEDWIVYRISRERKSSEWERKRIYRGFD